MSIILAFLATGMLTGKQKWTNLRRAEPSCGLAAHQAAMNAAPETAAMIQRIVIERIAHFA